jgi:hypothetical protein
MIEFNFGELLQKGLAAHQILRATTTRELDRIGDAVAGHVVDGRYFVNRNRGRPPMKDSMKVLRTGDFSRRIVSTARHARFLDEGTKPHWIVAKHAKFLRFVTGGSLVFRKRVFHPGTSPRQFSIKEHAFVESVLPGVLEVAMQEALGRAGLT